MAPSLDLVFAALADPTRRAILRMLLDDDMAVSDVASAFPHTLAGVSKHLQALAEAGLVSQERRGRITWCRIEPDGMREAAAFLAGFGLLAAVDLDGFERFLGSEGLAGASAPGAGALLEEGEQRLDLGRAVQVHMGHEP